MTDYEARELDFSYDGKSKRVFGALWGAMKSAGFNNDQIKTIKPLAWRTLDEVFLDDYEYSLASRTFLDAILGDIEGLGANEAQLGLIERSVTESLTFNFNEEGRGNR